jgi:hypothetical protein
MHKIKNIVPHDCNKHWQVITQIFQGYEETKLADGEEGDPDLKFGLMLQCSLCKQVAVVPYKPNVAPKTKEVTTDAEVKEPKPEVIQEG